MSAITKIRKTNDMINTFLAAKPLEQSVGHSQTKPIHSLLHFDARLQRDNSVPKQYPGGKRVR